MVPSVIGPGSLRVQLGQGAGGEIAVGLPLLAGAPVEQIFRGGQPAGKLGCFSLWQSADWLLGGCTLPVTGALAEPSQVAYFDLFRASRDWHLARIWNYVPAINGTGPGNLENYRSFCAGRSLAFEQQYGPALRSHMPSASAVGAPAGK